MDFQHLDTPHLQDQIEKSPFALHGKNISLLQKCFPMFYEKIWVYVNRICRKMLTKHPWETPGAFTPIFTHLVPAVVLLHFIDDLPWAVPSLWLCLWQSQYQPQEDHVNYYQQIVLMWTNQSRSLSSMCICETHPRETERSSVKSPKCCLWWCFLTLGSIYEIPRELLWHHCSHSKCKPIVKGMLVSVFSY